MTATIKNKTQTVQALTGSLEQQIGYHLSDSLDFTRFTMISSTDSCAIKSFSAARTSNDERVSSDIDVLRRFVMILSLRARCAEALETGKQQKMLYSMCRLGKPNS